MLTLAWTILFLPLLVAVAIFFLLMKHAKIAGFLATLAMAVAFVLTLCLVSDFISAGPTWSHESSLAWMTPGMLKIEFGVTLDGLALLMLLIVTGIGSLIFLYSLAYMEKDESFARFFACLSLFAFSMLGIVVSNNLIQVFIFWELVGLSSYLLIGFWYQKEDAGLAGKKAFLTTRVGDVGMMIGILALFGFLTKSGHGTFHFGMIRDYLAAAAIPEGWMTAIALLIFFGVVGKSAQVPLHVWLPDAMAGPTPVSALIHAATMVAAGVFLLARLFFLFSASISAMQLIAWMGGVTALLAGLMAISQNDIKKILAYSTLSQLGYMVMAVGLSSPEAGMFHLTTHACFKALLFLGAGSLIHALHTQDIWEMAGRARVRTLPVTTLTFAVGTFALIGLPPSSGFHSKEAILAAAHHGSTPLLILALVVVFLTAFYMGRLSAAVFFSDQNKSASKPGSGTVPHEPDWRMTVPLIVLALLSLAAGYFPIRGMLADSHAEGAHPPALLAFGSVALALAGWALAIPLFKNNPGRFSGTKILRDKFYFDAVYDWIIRNLQERIAALLDAFERRIVIEAAVNGLARLTRNAGDILRHLQGGMVQFYVLFLTGGVSALIYFYLGRGGS